jgi:1-hydroxycarotenoid 3,4-desaturase
MVRLARALAALAERLGAVVRVNAPVAEILVSRGQVTGVLLEDGERLDADAVVCNADSAALADGAFGRAAARSAPLAKRAGRSLSAVTWTLSAATEGFPLARHNVFFGGDYAAEFSSVFRHGRLPDNPTVYLCAQDRPGETPTGGAERLLVLINAPANGDHGQKISPSEIEQCTTRTFGQMERCGLSVHRSPDAAVITTPATFARLFPATGGALYGQAVHGSMAAFRRPGSRSALPGLYLAGGSVHPGPGLPMAVLSGRLAAASLLQDQTSR